MDEDKKAVSVGLFLLGLNSFALATNVSMCSLFSGSFPVSEDLVWRKIPPFSLLLPKQEENLKCYDRGDEIPPVVARAKAAHRNHTENTAMLVTFYVLYGYSGASSDLARTLILASATLRVVYGPCYMFGLAPWRTLVHLASQICGLSVAWIGVGAIFPDGVLNYMNMSARDL